MHINISHLPLVKEGAAAAAAVVQNKRFEKFSQNACTGHILISLYQPRLFNWIISLYRSAVFTFPVPNACVFECSLTSEIKHS